jgi:hypothetical protein
LAAADQLSFSLGNHLDDFPAYGAFVKIGHWLPPDFKSLIPPCRGLRSFAGLSGFHFSIEIKNPQTGAANMLLTIDISDN